MITPSQAIDAFNTRYGRHAGHRSLHAKGIVCTGVFTATPEAAALSRAPHLQGDPVRVTVRFSNGGGNPRMPDYAPDVRGMAVKFHLPDGTSTNVVAQTAPRFPVADPDAFVEMTVALDRNPAALWRLPWFLARNPSAIAPLRANAGSIRPPASYAAATYHAVHAFWWVAADGTRTAVRSTLVPDLHLDPPTAEQARAGGRDYLQDDVRTRLAIGPLRFHLHLQVAEPGDDVDDPRSVWPSSRRTVDAGTIDITATDEDGESGTDLLVYDPTTVPDGIELSDDPILAYRKAAYSESVARRTSG